MSVDTDITKLLAEEMQSLKQSIIDNMQRAGKTATGRTASSLNVIQNGTQATLEGASHLRTLETGRAPARSGTGDKQQLIQSLKEWIAAKGISYKDEQDLQRLASFFRWYINKFGTKQYRERERKEIFTNATQQLASKLQEKVSQLYTQELIRIVN